MAFRQVLLFLLCPAFSVAQLLSFGATGGVPISPQSQSFGAGSLLNGTTGPNDLVIRPWLAGGTAQLRLYRSFSLVGEFEYERTHEDFTYSSVKTGVNFGTRGSASANTWHFPLLIRYDLKRGRLAPFFDAGSTLRRLGPFNGQGYQLDFYLHPQPTSFHIVPGGNPEIAVTAGAGIRVPLGPINLLPEIRFLHWTSRYYNPVDNQAILTLGVVFPARRQREPRR